MRIAVLGTLYSPPFIRGGEEAVIHELKKQFERLGNSVDVYTPAFRKWKDLDAASSATNTTRLPVPHIPFLYHFSFARKLRRAVADKSYDVILNTHTPLGHALGKHPHVVIVATTARGEARSMRITGPMKLFEYVARKTLAAWTEKRVYDSADRVVCVGEHIADEVCEFYGTPRGKVVHIGNGVDCEKFSPRQDSQTDPAEAGAPIVIYAGRLVSRKNVELIIEAAAVLRDRGVDFRVHLCGEGPLRRALEALSESLGLSDVVKFLGRVDSDAMGQEYRRSAVFVLPSRYEGMPMVLLEAQACGLPAVVARFQGAEKIVRHGETGFIMRQDTPEEMAGLLDRLLSDESLRASMADRAREVMLSDFSWRHVADQYVALFRALADQPAAERHQPAGSGGGLGRNHRPDKGL